VVCPESLVDGTVHPAARPPAADGHCGHNRTFLRSPSTLIYLTVTLSVTDPVGHAAEHPGHPATRSWPRCWYRGLPGWTARVPRLPDRAGHPGSATATPTCLGGGLPMAARRRRPPPFGWLGSRRAGPEALTRRRPRPGPRELGVPAGRRREGATQARPKGGTATHLPRPCRDPDRHRRPSGPPPHHTGNLRRSQRQATRAVPKRPLTALVCPVGRPSWVKIGRLPADAGCL